MSASLPRPVFRPSERSGLPRPVCCCPSPPPLTLPPSLCRCALRRWQEALDLRCFSPPPSPPSEALLRLNVNLHYYRWNYALLLALAALYTASDAQQRTGGHGAGRRGGALTLICPLASARLPLSSPALVRPCQCAQRVVSAVVRGGGGGRVVPVLRPPHCAGGGRPPDPPPGAPHGPPHPLPRTLHLGRRGALRRLRTRSAPPSDLDTPLLLLVLSCAALPGL